jgi:hypothetical protein
MNGAVSMVNKGKPHHSFVYTLYITIGSTYASVGSAVLTTAKNLNYTAYILMKARFHGIP